MFDFRSKLLNDGRGCRYELLRHAAPLAYGEALELWRCDEGFREFFTGLLAEAPYRAYRWETPPVTVATLARPFEFVVLDSPSLEVPPDPADFQSYLEAGEGADDGTDVVAFANLGGDARLVVPRPLGPWQAYSHIAAFSRRAPAAQRHALWRRVGEEMEQHLGERPVWLSTAGGAVPWLHIRLDSRPKYYGYAPYREAPD